MAVHTLTSRELESLLRLRSTGGGRSIGAQLRAVIETSLVLTNETISTRNGAIAIGRSLRSMRYVASFGTRYDEALNNENDLPARLFGKAGREGKPAIVSLSDGKTVIVAPMVNASRVTGFLQVDAGKKSKAAQKKTMRVLALIADQLGQSIAVLIAADREHHLATLDPLTGAENVRRLYTTIERAIHKARNKDEDFALMFIDVDHLKRVNTKFGHAAGSEVLRRTAKALTKVMPFPGKLYRFGGDEFVATLPYIHRDDALDLADQLRAAVADATGGAMKNGDVLPRTTVSIGVATVNASLKTSAKSFRDESARLLTAADHALYRAKGQGRNRTVFATLADDQL